MICPHARARWSRDRTSGYKGGSRGRCRDRYDDGEPEARDDRGRFNDDRPLGTSTIWLGGLPPNISASAIERVCADFGTVYSVSMKTSSRDTFSFVEYGNERNARDAIRALDQTMPFGSGVIKVATASKKPTSFGQRDAGSSQREGRGESHRARTDSRDPRRCSYSERGRCRGGSGDRGRSYDRDRGPGRGCGREGDGHFNARGPGGRGDDRDGGYRRDSDRHFNPRGPDGRGDDRGGNYRHGRGEYDRGGHRQPNPGDQRRDRGVVRSPPQHPASAKKSADQANRPVKVYLSQLPRDMDEDELLEVASEYGEVLSHSLERQGAYKFGYVEYKRKSEAKIATQELDDRQMQGWHMRLQAYMYPTG